jgi:hypothetical protein
MKESGESTCGGETLDFWQANASGSGPAFHLVGTGYEEHLFRDEALRVLAEHSPSVPLLLFYAAHVGHFPLQVPRAAFEATTLEPAVGDEAACGNATFEIWPGFDPANGVDGYSCRRQYHAMINLLDGVLEKIHEQVRAQL